MKTKHFLVCSAVLLLGMTARAQQTWEIGYPNAADVTATLSNGTLTISGTGDMQGFSSPSYAPWYNSRSTITTGVIQDGVTSIGQRAFYVCSDLTFVTIPNSVTSIGEWAFSNCSGLTSVTFPNSVTSIGEAAFYDCSGLTSVTIPNSVTSIGEFAFYGCSELTSIDVDNANPTYSSENSILYDKDKTLLHIYPARKTNSTFAIPNSVASIGNNAFYGCSGLTSVTIPNSVASIGSNAFYGCSGLKKLTVADGTSTLLFEGTDSYSYSASCFNDCPLDTVYLGRDISYYTTGGYYSGYSYSSPFSNKTTKVLTIGNNVTSIGGAVFSGCSGLTSVTIPNSVTNIEESAFSGCSGLTSVTIPNSVTSIGRSAFEGCLYITVTNLNPAPQTITSNVFYLTYISSSTLYVPASSANAYRVATGWENFGHIVGLHTITFNARGGSSVPAQYAAAGSTLTPPLAPTREGYTFGGWFYEIACQNEWFFDSDVVTADITLYAKWIEAVHVTDVSLNKTAATVAVNETVQH